MATQQSFPFSWSKETREQRKAQLLGIIHGQPGLTYGALVARMGLRKTPYARAMLIELLHDGLITYGWATYTNGVRGMVYFPAEVGASDNGN